MNRESSAEAARAAPLLVVRDLRKSYQAAAREPEGGVEVLRGASFSVAAGEMVAVVGASGAGKSTLLHVLGGLDEADGGSAHLEEFCITRAGAPDLAQWRNRYVGFVFQVHNLLPDLTATENVALPLVIARHSWRDARSRARRALDSAGLGARHTERKIGELSGGEQQRAAIARALVTEPRLVLADEPTGNLDARTGEEIARSLLSLCREHRAAAVVATHNRELARACDRVLRLADGRLE